MNLCCFLFEAFGKQDLLLFIESKEFHLTLKNLLDIFKALNFFKLDFAGQEYKSYQ